MGEIPAAPRLVALGEPFDVKPVLTVFVPVKLATNEFGNVTALPRPTRGSGDFTSLLGTDGFVELPPGPVTMARGAAVPLYEW
jgi:molybdopterin molybdotransferase